MLARSRVVLFALLLILTFAPVISYAMGTMADQMCIGDPCPCGKGPPGKCDKGGNGKLMCPCWDVTSGFVTMGKCAMVGKCEASGTSDGKGPDAGLSKLGEILGKLMEALKGGGGGGGGGGSGTGSCTTMQPTSDQALVSASPQCYYYKAVDLGGATTTDPSGGLVASPTDGPAPLGVYFAYTNGSSGCNTPTLSIDFGDGSAEQAPIHAGSICNSFSESTQHTYDTPGAYSARLKNNSTGAVIGGVNITATDATSTTSDNTNNNNNNNTDNGTGTSTSTGGSTDTTNTNTSGTTFTATKGNATNISTTLFNTPLTNLNSSGSLSNGGNGGTNSITGGSVSTGGSSGAGASLNFNSPQSIVQSIISKNLPPGAYGDVKILQNGTTIIAGVRDQTTEVAGFYGTNGSSQGQGTVGRLCANRPWATNFLSRVIPASFFDSLCTWRGYPVGPQKTTTPTTFTTSPTKSFTTTTIGTKPPTKAATTTTTTTTTATSSASSAARVDIWASPMTVPLGARTSVFWNSQGVTDCIETSPDGSFSHDTTKGGASTVPLTTATTFTISCVTAKGQHVTKNVTVQIDL